MNLTRLFKNSEGNRDGAWIFVEGRKETLLYYCISDKNEKEQKNLRSNLNWSIIAPKRSAKMIDGTENAKFLRSLQNAQRDRTNFAKNGTAPFIHVR